MVCKAPGGRTERDITFQGIGRNEYSKLFKFLSDKNIPIKNIKVGLGFRTICAPVVVPVVANRMPGPFALLSQKFDVRTLL